MANAREIQGRIKSIQDTRKITNAMYMISSTKLKKAKNRLEQTEPYFYTIQSMISRILRHIPPDVHSRFFDQRPKITGPQRKRGLIVVAGDKGLAGAYNHNILKLAESWYREEGENHLFVVGELGRQYFLSHGIPVEEHFQYTAQSPSMHRARLINEVIMSKFENMDLDEVEMVYTYINGMEAIPQTQKLLPMSRIDFGNSKIPQDVILEEFVMNPSPREVLDNIVPNYITGFIYGALVEAFCSEQNARMQAMQSATDSANSMLHDLGIQYNRVRQAAITQEITEVASGAKAQKKKKKKKQ